MREDQIPVMDDPLGRHWRQPSGLRERVTLDATHALVEERDFVALPEYSTTIPTGVYPGKAWRRQEGLTWLLCWFGPDIGGRCEICFRKALLV